MSAVPAPGARARAVAAALLLGLVALGLGARLAGAPARCPDGSVEIGARCCGQGQSWQDDRCAGEPARCPAGLDVTPSGCVVRGGRVAIEAATLGFDVLDWEAVGAELPAKVPVAAFSIDAYEVTEARWAECVTAGPCVARPTQREPGLPVTAVTAAEADSFCRFAGGTLPTPEQWVLAGAGPQGRRYPWGATGAVCRRASFGLSDGPCGSGARGPDLAGARPDGATADGIHDLAGNVAELALPVARPTARGGSFRDRTAGTIRTWSSRRVAPDGRYDDVGFRCVYPR